MIARLLQRAMRWAMDRLARRHERDLEPWQLCGLSYRNHGRDHECHRRVGHWGRCHE